MLKLNKQFQSELDQFLTEFDQQFPRHSASQQTEIKKQSILSQMRDNATPIK